jgi:hypothetical protein
VEVVPIYSNVWRKENTQLLQKLKVAVKSNILFTKETITDECQHIAAEEGLFAFHTIKHNHYFRFMDFASSVVRRLHEEKFLCGQTKCESIVINILAPFAMQPIF